jgi:hypothetical protein
MAPSAPDDDLPVYLPVAAHPGGYVVIGGKLPVSELAYDRAGAASPFGDDLRFPLPVGDLTYVHPDHSYDESGDAHPHH